MENLNFVRGNKPSTSTRNARKKILEKDICYECKRIFNKSFLDVEHNIPVCIGGHVEDYLFYCKECHKKKTKIDNLVITFLKRTGLLIKIGSFSYETPITFLELKEVYLLLREKIKEGKNVY